MGKYRFANLDIKISPHGDAYRATVVASPVGHGQHDFQLPFQDSDLELFVLRIAARRAKVRRIQTHEQSETRKWGTALFSALFAGEIGPQLQSSKFYALSKRVGLRIRLDLADVPRLMDLPWEFLFDPVENDFVAASRRTPIVRYLRTPKPPKALDVESPLRILVAAAAPRGSVPLDAHKELESLRTALSEPIAKGTVVVEDMEATTRDKLRKRLRNEELPIHILHFIGHGVFDQRQSDGQLAFEDKDGNEDLVGATDFARVVSEHWSLRLVVLNSCEGARTSKSDPFSGVAQTLMRRGIPAVLAMQFEITDDAACAIAKELYTCLGEGLPLESAVSEARVSLIDKGNYVEWATPVLYLQTDGQIFSIHPHAKSTPSQTGQPSSAQSIAHEVARAAQIADDSKPTAPTRDIPLLLLPPATTDLIVKKAEHEADAVSAEVSKGATEGEEDHEEDDVTIDRLLVVGMSAAAACLVVTLFFLRARAASAWSMAAVLVLLPLAAIYVARRWVRSKSP